MKNLLLLLALFSPLCLNGQTYLISFTGTGLTNVKVENLSSGITVNVPAGDVLRLSLTTGLNDINSQEQSYIKVYPNPVKENLTFELLPPAAGDAIISVTDISGREIISYREYLDNSRQTFLISGIQEGFHIINARGKGYQYSSKFISAGSSPGKPLISRISDNKSGENEPSKMKESKGTSAYVDMNFHSGEILKYTATSGNNKTIMTGSPTGNTSVSFSFTECKDGDNNYYPVVKINNQIWMAENLKTTKYKNGTTPIPNVTDSEQWRFLETPAYCLWDNNAAYKDVYGALYNAFTVNTGNLCPTGWHVPSWDEWKTLEVSIGVTPDQANIEGWTSTTEGNELKETGTSHWAEPNLDATNEWGFTALPAGYRTSAGVPEGLQGYAVWWSNTPYSTVENRSLLLVSSYGYIFNYCFNNRGGLSVRCLKD